MEHILPLSAAQIESRLSKIPDSADVAVDIFCEDCSEEIYNDVNCIVVKINHEPTDGLEIKFKSPVACSAVTKLLVKQVTDEGSEVVTRLFAFADANGNDVGKIDSLFAKNAIVKVILDLNADIAGVDGAAFVQNADTNVYLENEFEKVRTAIKEVQDITQNISYDLTASYDENTCNVTLHIIGSNGQDTARTSTGEAIVS
jgi:hypothetical protein